MESNLKRYGYTSHTKDMTFSLLQISQLHSHTEFEFVQSTMELKLSRERLGE